MKFPIPDDWDNESWCQWAVCWPKSEKWEGFLRGLLTLPARGRTWDERTGSILEIQAVGRKIDAKNLPLVGVFMSCNDTELIASFSEIAAAIRYAADKQCCPPLVGGGEIGPNAGYQGSVTQPIGGNVIPIYGNSPPRQLAEGETFPDGFANVEEWDLHKCSIANMIFDGVLYTCAFLASLTITNIVALAGLIAAGIAGILVFPPAGIAIMVGAVLAIGGFMAMFLQIRLELIERRSDFICAMYEAENVSLAISVIADFLDVVIFVVIPGGGLVAGAFKTALLLMFNADTLNQLFDATADYLYPDADCSGCIECDPIEREWVGSSNPDYVGVEISQIGDVVTATNSTPAADGQYYAAFNDVNICPFFASDVSTTGAGGIGVYQNCEGDFVEPSTWLEVEGIAILGIGYRSVDEPCSITATVSPAECL